MLALVLGLIISTGLYFAYLWPSVELADAAPARPDAPAAAPGPADAPRTASPPP